MSHSTVQRDPLQRVLAAHKLLLQLMPILAFCNQAFDNFVSRLLKSQQLRLSHRQLKAILSLQCQCAAVTGRYKTALLFMMSSVLDRKGAVCACVSTCV
jgi:hypothetical protein